MEDKEYEIITDEKGYAALKVKRDKPKEVKVKEVKAPVIKKKKKKW